MSMSRAELVAELWGRLGTQFTEAGITNTDTTGHLKEPVDSALGSIGVPYSQRSTATVSDELADAAIEWAVCYGCVCIIASQAHTGVSGSWSVGAPSVSESENREPFIRTIERMRDEAEEAAKARMPGGSWAFGDLSLGIYAGGAS